MDGSTFFDRLLEHRGMNPNSLASAIKRPSAQSGFDRLRKGEIKSPRRSEKLELAAKYLGVNVLAFFDEKIADAELARVEAEAVNDRKTVDPNTIDGDVRWLDDKGPSDAISYTSLADQRQQNLTGSSQAWNVTNWGDLPDKGAVMVPMLAIGKDGAVALDRDGCEPMSARDLKRKKMSPPHAAWLAAPDNGMEPAIWEDETVVIDTSQTAVRDGKIYAVFYAGSVKLRRVFITPTGGMTIKPENPAFEVIELEKEDVHTVKVIGLYGFHITSLA